MTQQDKTADPVLKLFFAANSTRVIRVFTLQIFLSYMTTESICIFNVKLILSVPPKPD